MPRPPSGLRRAPRVVALLALLTPFAPTFATPGWGASIPVTTCGQVVDGTGYLVGDLDCSAWSGPAVTLLKRGKLLLGGFNILADGDGVACSGSCTVRGPGRIDAVAYPTVTDPLDYGIQAIGHLRAFDVSLKRWAYGLLSIGQVRAQGCTVEDGGFGVLGTQSVRVFDSHINNQNTSGVAGNHTPPTGGLITKFKIVGTTFSGNNLDILAARLPIVRDSTCTTSCDFLHPPCDVVDDWGVCS